MALAAVVSGRGGAGVGVQEACTAEISTKVDTVFSFPHFGCSRRRSGLFTCRTIDEGSSILSSQVAGHGSDSDGRTKHGLPGRQAC